MISTNFVQELSKQRKNKEVVSIAYQGNIVDVWEKFLKENILIEIGSDQTSLHKSVGRRILSGWFDV